MADIDLKFVSFLINRWTAKWYTKISCYVSSTKSLYITLKYFKECMLNEKNVFTDVVLMMLKYIRHMSHYDRGTHFLILLPKVGRSVNAELSPLPLNSPPPIVFISQSSIRQDKTDVRYSYLCLGNKRL